MMKSSTSFKVALVLARARGDGRRAAHVAANFHHVDAARREGVVTSAQRSVGAEVGPGENEARLAILCVTFSAEKSRCRKSSPPSHCPPGLPHGGLRADGADRAQGVDIPRDVPIGHRERAKRIGPAQIRRPWWSR